MERAQSIMGLEKAWNAILEHLKVHERKACTIKEYRIAYGRLCDFYLTKGIREYDEAINDQFRLHVECLYAEGLISLNYRRLFIRLAKYIDNHHAGKRITDMRSDTVRMELPVMEDGHELSERHKALLGAYEDHVQGMADWRMLVESAGNLLRFIESNSLDGITEVCTIEYIIGLMDSGRYDSATRRRLTAFLAYAEGIGIASEGAARLAAAIRKRRNKDIMPAFSPSEVNAMLHAIDAETPEGKRDTAIVLLAACTGMRGCDVIEVALDGYDPLGKTISFRQRKTGVMIKLPLMSMVSEAISKYISEGRPRTAAAQLFVSHKYPYGSIRNISAVFLPMMKRAGIEKAAGKGFHSFRRMLGGLLLESGARYDMISQILGHIDSKSAVHYMPYGIEALSACVMEIPGGG